MLADFQDSGLGSPPVLCNPSPDWSVGDAVMLMLSKFSGISVPHEFLSVVTVWSWQSLMTVLRVRSCVLMV